MKWLLVMLLVGLVVEMKPVWPRPWGKDGCATFDCWRARWGGNVESIRGAVWEGLDERSWGVLVGGLLNVMAAEKRTPRQIAGESQRRESGDCLLGRRESASEEFMATGSKMC